MLASTPKVQEAKKAAEQLEKKLKLNSKSITIADAAAQSGLSMLNTERALQYLVSEYRGHLAATESGELLFSFPTGFTKPWENIDRLKRFWNKVKKPLLGAAKFVVRAWISIVLVAYVAIFALILLALSFAKSSDREEGSFNGGGILLHSLVRIIFDSLFWTFHPFSPFNVAYYHDADYHYARKKKEGHFYEKVNRYFFGPEKAVVDELETIKNILAEIRAQNGRIGMSDIIRVTGLERDKAEALISRLMLDYDGDVVVAENGGILYRFISFRKTTEEMATRRPAPIWDRLEKLLPLTGNSVGTNMLISALNGFNLVMSTVAINAGWTIERLRYIFTITSEQIALGIAPQIPEGTPLLLGWIPFYFSVALFALPITRLLFRPREKKRVAYENGRKGFLRGVLTRLGISGVDEKTLKREWAQFAQEEPSDKAIIHEVAKLGGEAHITDSGNTIYRFAALEAEHKALTEDRQNASARERDVGRVVFSSAKD